MSQILKPRTRKIGAGPNDEVLPFVNAKYRSDVRVVGYFPNKIQDFAVARVNTEYDILSDNDESDESDLDVEEYQFQTQANEQKTWEWRFALEIQDAGAGAGLAQERIWILVDNAAAQCLLDLDAVE